MYRAALALTFIILFAFLLSPVQGVRYHGVFEYPPLESAPSSMVVDDAGGMWFALPVENLVAKFVPDVGLRIVDLGFRATDLVHAHGIVVAYEPGSSDIAFIDAVRAEVVWRSTEAGSIDDVVAVDTGFVLVKKFPTLSLLVQVSPTGEAFWENSIADKQLERYRPAAGSGGYVWLRTTEGNILLVELGREGYKEFRMEKKPVILASREGKVWAIDSEGGVVRVSIRGVEARFNIGSAVRLGDFAFALQSDRLVILSRIEQTIVEISGGQVSREASQIGFVLAASKGSSEVYLLDPGEKRVVVVVFSRPPVVSDASASAVGDGGRVRVTARVSDPDGDLAAGYPRAVGLLGTAVVSEEMTRAGDTYTAELSVPGGNGTLRVYVSVVDVGGNEVRQDVATFEVSGGKIAGAGPAQPTQPTSSPSISEFFPLAVEMSLFLVLVTAIVLVWMTRMRKGNRRRRR